MNRRLIVLAVALGALAACGREGPLVSGLASPTPTATAFETPLATATPEATATPQATETPTPAETETPGAISAPSEKSGIFGSVKSSPECPPGQSSPCPERPVAGAEVTARDQSGKVAGTTRADAEGKFTLGLAPGKYKVTASSPSVGSCDEQDVEVTESHYTPVRIDCAAGPPR